MMVSLQGLPPTRSDPAIPPRLRYHVGMDERYLQRRAQIETLFAPERRAAEPGMTVVSPSGQYRLDVWHYASGRPGVMGCTRGVVTRLADGRVVADVKRNFCSFWHEWVEHPNGNKYLLCGEDYQGYSVVNLTEGRYHVHFPERGYEGWGWCWASVQPSPDRLLLAVHGCQWACPYDVRILDFRDPDVLPLSEIAVFESVDARGWQDNDTYEMQREVEIRKSDGARYVDLPEEQQDRLDADPSLVEEITERVYFQRNPS
jgi:hypothetical protein